MPEVSNNVIYSGRLFELSATPSIHVYFACSADCSERQAQEFLGVLSADERCTLQALRDKTTFKGRLVSHGLLRQLLAQKTGRAESDLVIEKTAYGKPYLSSSPGAPNFSLAHSHDWIAIALSDGRQVGVDLERINPTLVTDQLIEDLTSEDERRQLASLPSAEHYKRFFELWTEKESLLKAAGTGLSGMSSILAKDFDRSTYFGNAWQTIALCAPSGYAAAISFADGHGDGTPVISEGGSLCHPA